MRIRQYKKSDFDEILDINNKTFKGVECPPVSTLREMISISDTFIAAVNLSDDGYPQPERVAGFAIVQPYPVESKDQQAYIWQMATSPDLQCRGIGGNLLREVIGYYTKKKYASIRLHVHYNNPAQKLYFDCGFRVYDIAWGYYRDDSGDSVTSRALKMKRSL
jgi:ribosomal protein S18 acetylase RimI-like enzyme